jgi:flagellar basal body-associated protein FliL
MSNTTILILVLLLAFAFVFGGIMMLSHNKKFKLPDDWHEKQKNKKTNDWDDE